MTADRQDALVQDLAGVVLSSLDLAETWAAVAAVFTPHGEGWAGRMVITDRDGTVGRDQCTVAADTQTALLLDALRTAAAEDPDRPCFRMDATRSPQQPERIRLETAFVRDQGPGGA
ncbi:hypothetical protein [Brachybacterium sp. UNK5269]|uniref:hypothetical protein n=1 Tax=Brachybacterium sp. UNK5269 TaxID=3408576 RepID=UPI003BB066DF